jgi:photosystem II stability/assembly factor-like uncharacterized protein
MKSSHIRRLVISLAVLAVLLRSTGTPAQTKPNVAFAIVGNLPSGCDDGCSLQMMTPDFGWLFSRSALWLSTDAGKSWESRLIPQIRRGDSGYLGFLNREEGWMFNASQQLFLTTDSASHWRPVDPPPVDGVMQTAWASPKAGLIWLGGGVYRPSQQPDAPNYALKRSDSGWAVLHPAILSRRENAWAQRDLPGCSWTLVSLRILGDGHAVAFGDGCAYYSDTTGNTWAASVMRRGTVSSRSYPGDASHPTSYFLSSVAGWLQLDDHTLWKTGDGGRSWNLIAAHAPVFKQFQFISERHGLGITRTSVLYETTDGGATWEVVKTRFIARSLHFLDDKHGWVTSGSELYVIRWE